MATRGTLFLFLFILGLFSVSLQCYNSLEDPGWTVADDEDDQEDLEEGLEKDASGDQHFAVGATAASSKVTNVNDQDVARVVAKFEYVLLLVTAPWNRQSQELLQEFAVAAVELSRQGNPTVLAKLVAVNNPAAASVYDIRGFPTLLFFINTVCEEYYGGNSREDIVRWVQKKSGFSVTTITSIEEAEYFLKKKGTVTLGYFDNFEGPDHDAFLEAAQAEADTEFVLTSVPEVAQLFMSPPIVAVRKQEPERFSVFSTPGGMFNAKEITAFVELNKHPLVTLLNSKNANTVYSSPLRLQILLFAESKDYESVKYFYSRAAKQFKEKVMFLVIDLEDEEFFKLMLSSYGLNKSKPVVSGLNSEDGSRYLLESDLTYENLKNFAAGLYAGKLPLYFKSQPIPAKNDGVVKIVVGKTLDEIVMDETKDVFLFVHTPWCASVEKVGRVFEKLAKQVQGVPSLVMAKYDAQDNEHPLLMDVPSYPSLCLYPSGRKPSNPIIAKSQTSWKKLLMFLKENAAIPFPVDTPALNSNIQKEPAEVKTIPEELNEIGATASLEVAVASEIKQREGLYTQQSLLKDEL